MILLCNRVRELYIIKIVLTQGLNYLGMILREKRKNKNKRDHIDLMESNDFTYKEYYE